MICYIQGSVYQNSPLNQKSASTFVLENAMPLGLGYLPLITRFDPTHYLAENSLYEKLKPTPEDIQNATEIQVCLEKPGFVSVGELESNGVHEQFIAALKKLDSIFSDNGLRNAGLSLEDCILPVVAFSGVTIIFGATILLQDSFPTFVPLSKQLDMIDMNENLLASAYLKKFKSFCQCQILKPVFNNENITECRLNLSRYYVKTITPDVYNRGIGFFSTSNDDCLNIHP
eukprot:gene32115-42866_t